MIYGIWPVALDVYSIGRPYIYIRTGMGPAWGAAGWAAPGRGKGNIPCLPAASGDIASPPGWVTGCCAVGLEARGSGLAAAWGLLLSSAAAPCSCGSCRMPPGHHTYRQGQRRKVISMICRYIRRSCGFSMPDGRRGHEFEASKLALIDTSKK